MSQVRQPHGSRPIASAATAKGPRQALLARVRARHRLVTGGSRYSRRHYRRRRVVPNDLDPSLPMNWQARAVDGQKNQSQALPCPRPDSIIDSGLATSERQSRSVSMTGRYRRRQEHQLGLRNIPAQSKLPDHAVAQQGVERALLSIERHRLDHALQQERPEFAQGNAIFPQSRAYQGQILTR